MFLPPRRKRPKMMVRSPLRRSFPTHRSFVKRHQCAVKGCEEGPVEFHHVKTRGAGGGDEFGVPLCARHHKEFHDIGIATFEAKHRIDLRALAAEFVRRTTDKALREALKLVEYGGGVAQ